MFFIKKKIGYHPQCVDFGLDVCFGEKYVISTGSMNFVYIWEIIEKPAVKSNIDLDDMKVDFSEIQQIQQFPNSFCAQPQFNGWGYQVIGHDDFANLSSSTQIVFESDEEDTMDDEDDDIIIVNANGSSNSQNFSQNISTFSNLQNENEEDEDDDEIKIIGFTA